MSMSIEELKEQERQFFEIRDKIMEEADKQGVTLRLIGAIAFRTQCPDYKYLEYDLGRQLTDIDFVGYEKETRKIEKLFDTLGWKSERALHTVMKRMGANRMIFYGPGEVHSDVFLDGLRFCHILKLKDRLEIDDLTISLSDLLLEKLQIVEINEKDIVDCIMLFREHKVGTDDETTINKNYIANLFANDWGWWRTSTENLENIKHFTERYDKLTEEDKQIVINRIEELEKAIDEQSKPFSWKMRNKIGDKKKWYRDVEEVER